MANNNSIRLSRSRPKVYITRRVPQIGLDALLEGCNVAMWDSEDIVPRGELLNGVADVDCLLCMSSDVIDTGVLKASGPNLKVIGTVSPDCDHIDVTECERRGIRVLCCPNQSIEGMADLAVALILLTLKSSTEGTKLDNGTNGKPNPVCLKNFRNRTFGIYGLTKLGHGVAKRLRELGVSSIIAADLNRNPSSSFTDSEIEIVSWNDFIEKTDIFCICEASGSSKDYVFAKDTFKKMKNRSVLVNFEKGGFINYFDLYEALRDGDISAAGLNDCNQQPVPFKYPLAGLQNCVFLPQTEESSFDLRHKTSVSMARNLLGALYSHNHGDNKTLSAGTF